MRFLYSAGILTRVREWRFIKLSVNIFYLFWLFTGVFKISLYCFNKCGNNNVTCVGLDRHGYFACGILTSVAYFAYAV